MNRDTVLVTVLPQQLRDLQGWNVTPAHLTYRLGAGCRLLRAGGPLPRGGVMVLADQGYDGSGPMPPFYQELIRECRARCFSGAILDFDRRLPPMESLVSQLDHSFQRLGWSLYVPEAYGLCAPNARVLIPSALSGGSLEQRLNEAVEAFGRDRVVLALQMAAEDFFLPSPTGCGAPLSPEELQQLKQRLSPSVFFSHELCARYFTYMSRDSGAHFVLFDDAETLRRKMDLARRVGIHTFLAVWSEVCRHTQALGLTRLSPASAPR